MAAIKFILQSKKNPANIYIRLMFKGRNIKRKTGLVIDPKKWNASKGMPKTPNETYMQLSKIAENVWDKFNKVDNPDGKWLENVLYGTNERLSDIIELYLENMDNMRNSKGGKGLSNNRKKNMNSFYKLIMRFGDCKVSEVDKRYGERLIDWMNEYSNNYMVKTVENLKTVLRYGEKNGVEIDKSIFNLETYWEKKVPVILNENELKYIKTLELNERLANVRKWLLFGCYTGQRVGDLFGIQGSDIKEVRGRKIIELTQEKTFSKVVIPLVPEALEVIEGGFPRAISQQRFNSYLIELMELAEIDKKITSHCMRRSFASNYYGVIPTPLLMQITGHKKEQTFLGYIGKSEYDMAFEFLEHYNNK